MRSSQAMSSRNIKLTEAERVKAPALYAALMEGKAAVEAGERSCAKVEQLMRERLQAAGEVVYAICVDADSLQPMEVLTGDLRLIASLKLGVVPLVDNVGASAG